MKIVYLNSNNTVREILPDSILFNEIPKWYNSEFASHCIKTPDEVEQGWKYDTLNQVWYSPENDKIYTPPESVIQEIIDGI